MPGFFSVVGGNLAGMAKGAFNLARTTDWAGVGLNAGKWLGSGRPGANTALGAIGGGITGGIYGAASENTSFLGGMMGGAAIGAGLGRYGGAGIRAGLRTNKAFNRFGAPSGAAAFGLGMGRGMYRQAKRDMMGMYKRGATLASNAANTFRCMGAGW